jgi:hypothetical protein
MSVDGSAREWEVMAEFTIETESRERANKIVRMGIRQMNIGLLGEPVFKREEHGVWVVNICVDLSAAGDFEPRYCAHATRLRQT